MTRILVLVTNSAQLGDADDNGTFAPELTHALHVFKEAGHEYDLVSIQGGNAPMYGMETDDPVNQAMPFTLLVPFFGVASGVVLLGETVSAELVFGGLLTVLGVAIIVVRRPQTTAPEAERV